MSQKKEITLFNFTQDLAIGSLSTSFFSTMLYSLGRVKVIFTSQGERLRDDKSFAPYKGLIDCFKRTITEDGISCLLKGNIKSSKLWYSTAFSFSFYDTFKRMLNKNKEESWGFSANLISGGLAGFSTTTLFYSLQQAEKKLTEDIQIGRRGKRQFKGLIDVYKKTLSQEGISGLHKQFLPRVIGSVIYRGMYFGFYDTIISHLSPNLANSFFASFSVGYFVTTISCSVVYPIEILSGRAEMNFYRQQNKRYFDIFQEMYHQEGFQSFFRGLRQLAHLRSLVGGATLATYDQIQRLVYNNTFKTSQ